MEERQPKSATPVNLPPPSTFTPTQAGLEVLQQFSQRLAGKSFGVTELFDEREQRIQGEHRTKKAP